MESIINILNEHSDDAAFELATDRLVLRLITIVDITAVLEDRPLSDWAPDFPAEGDKVIAKLLSRVGVPSGDARAYGHRLVVERETGQVVGGVGLFGPPQDGRVEIGYGIVESRRCRGYATEAVIAMLDYGFSQPDVLEVVASTDLNNHSSIRVLEKCGFAYESEDESEVSYLVRSAR